jgi:hypothetical protein
VIFRVAERLPAVLDDVTRVEVAERLFARFVDERLQSAHVEWQWGSVPARAADEVAQFEEDVDLQGA